MIFENRTVLYCDIFAVHCRDVQIFVNYFCGETIFIALTRARLPACRTYANLILIGTRYPHYLEVHSLTFQLLKSSIWEKIESGKYKITRSYLLRVSRYRISLYIQRCSIAICPSVCRSVCHTNIHSERWR